MLSQTLGTSRINILNAYSALIFIVRMAYAFSRDGAMPFSSLWHKVNKQEVPIYAVWLSAFVSFCMALTVN